jgi:lauroyl/myristoyl acyltransferase
MPISHTLQYCAFIYNAQIMRILARRTALFLGACIGQFAWRTGIRRSLVLSNLRQAILEHPDQYLWYHRRWRDSDSPLEAQAS